LLFANPSTGLAMRAVEAEQARWWCWRQENDCQAVSCFTVHYSLLEESSNRNKS
jgi:hypothetical protein